MTAAEAFERFHYRLEQVDEMIRAVGPETVVFSSPTETKTLRDLREYLVAKQNH